MIIFEIPYSSKYQIFANKEIFEKIEKLSDKIEYDTLCNLSLFSVSIKCNSNFDSLSLTSNLTGAIKKHFNGFSPKSILITIVDSPENRIVLEFSKFSDLVGALDG